MVLFHNAKGILDPYLDNMAVYVKTSHPKFKLALLVLLKQLLWQMVSCAIFMAAPDAVHMEVLRYPVHFLVSDRFHLPEVMIAAYTMHQLWASREIAPWTGLGQFYSEEEYETHRLIIHPVLQEWLWLGCSACSWVAASFVIRRYPPVAAALIASAYILHGIYGLPFVAPLWCMAEPPLPDDYPAPPEKVTPASSA